jgi:hypothetical protein
MGFDPYNRALKIRESIWYSNSHNGNALGNVKVHAFTLFALPKACDVTPGLPSWPATLQALALVASPYLGHKPLPWVATVVGSINRFVDYVYYEYNFFMYI